MGGIARKWAGFSERPGPAAKAQHASAGIVKVCQTVGDGQKKSCRESAALDPRLKYNRGYRFRSLPAVPKVNR
jgi:hypothetical protein